MGIDATDFVCSEQRPCPQCRRLRKQALAWRMKRMKTRYLSRQRLRDSSRDLL